MTPGPAPSSEVPATASSASARPTIVVVSITVILWSSAFAGIREGLRSYGPLQLVAFRFILASLVLLALARPLGLGLPRRRDLPAFFALGFSGMTLYPLALAIGEQHVTAGVASMVLASQTIIVAALATIFLGERLSVWGWLGSLIGFAGIGVISLGQSSGLHVDLQVLWVLFAALATSVYFVFQKPLLRRYSALEVATWCIWCGTIFVLPFAGALPKEIAASTWQPTASVVYLAVFPTAIAYLTWSDALSRAPASLIINALYLVPPLAVLIAYLWLGERPSPLSFVGGAVTLAGVALIGFRGRAQRSSGSQVPASARTSTLSGDSSVGLG